MPQSIIIHVAANGRMVLPHAARAALGVTGAGIVALSVDGDDVRLTTISASVAGAQALYRTHVVDDQPSDRLLAARRHESAKDRTAGR